MKWLYTEELFRYLQRNRKRTFISIAGIALGVFSLVVMSGISGAMTKKTLEELGKFGSRLVIAAPGDLVVFGHKRAQIGTVHTLNLADADAIAEKIPHVGDVSPLRAVTLPTESEKHAQPESVMGVSPSFTRLLDLEPACGRGLIPQDLRSLRKVAVIGSRIAADFFEDSCPIGKMLTISDIPFRVIGVLAPRGSVGMEDYDSTILVPVSVAQRLLSRSDWLDGIYILTDSEAFNEEVIAQTEALLRVRHGKKDFTVMAYEAAAGTTADMEHLFSVLSIIVAAIAYSVGALGIVAIMALSMYERLIEIAVKRVVGATRRDLFFQFFFESTMLALSGAMMGAIAATVVVFGVEAAAGWPFYLPVGTLFLSMALSVGIGILASLYPARRAMHFEPVTILKLYEEV
ncbi:ABC transporter permease [Hydrogenimonas urashimensis]|uniref:ABC transporter permease n=1 Tax=Hydrogenimonas urashimensis TaxID=2740515 RepID=UPI00191658D2|nr:ABC transporter permease [Hydrogenimonas urashimensis]